MAKVLLFCQGMSGRWAVEWIATQQGPPPSISLSFWVLGWNLFHPWCSALQPAEFYVLALKMECLWCIIIIIIVIIVIVIIYLHLKPQLWLAFCWALSCIQLQSFWTEWKWCGEVDKQEERSQEKFDAENVSLSRSLWCAILWPGIAWKLLILL